MFLIDSFRNYRSTEPIWFRFLRSFFSIALTTMLIYYSWIQFKKIGVDNFVVIKFIEFEYPNLDAPEETFELNIKLCTRISSEMQIVVDNIRNDRYSIYNDNTSYCQSVPLLFSRFNSQVWLNVSITNVTAPFNSDNMQRDILSTLSADYPYQNALISNNLLFLSFESSKFNNFSGLQNDTFYANPTVFGLVKLENNYFSLYPEQAVLISLEPIILRDFEYFKEYLKLNPQLEQLPIKLESNEFQFGIRTRSNMIKFQETKNYDYIDLMANLGGFYSGVGGIFILFFGMPKHAPWGVVQKYILSCVPCRKSFARNFARKYISSAGIPLAEKVNKRPRVKESPLETLEERVQILETLLADYYLDNFYLKKVKEIKINNEKYSRKYDEINNEKSYLVSSKNNEYL